MSREFLAGFIKMYESEPCLWQVNSKDYRDRDKKEAGYAKLLGKMNEIEPNATKDSVIKKINNLRSAFRKEKKKMKDSLKSGAPADSVYKPKLWYFSLLSFLCDQDNSRTSRSNMNSDDNCADDENTCETEGQSEEEIVQQGGSTQNSGEGISNKPLTSTRTCRPPTSRTQFPKKGTKLVDTQDLGKDVLVQVNEHFNTEEDRFDVISKTFAIKLRGLPKQQMLLAEKLMNETLFLAEMGYLTLSHRLVGEENPHLLSRYFSPVPYQGTSASTLTSYNSQTHSSTPSLSPQAGMHQQLLHEHIQEFQSNVPYGFKLPINEHSDSGDEQPRKKAKVIGPERPSFIAEEKFEKELNSPEPKDESQASTVIGPVLPGTCLQNSDEDDDDDSEVYGPLPPQTKQDYDIVKIIENRAVNMKNKLDMKDIPAVQSSQREEWMVVPDTSRRNQLGAISRCLAPGSKIAKKETEYRNPEEDEKTSEELKKYNESKRNKSLLEMHQKKKKEKKPERQERKAFDRDEIATRHFNKKQVNSVIDKAKYLNSRFAPGRSNQYL